MGRQGGRRQEQTPPARAVSGGDRGLGWQRPRRRWRRGRACRCTGENFRRNLAIVDAVTAIGAEIGATPAQTALAWILTRGDDIAPIPGTRRVARGVDVAYLPGLAMRRIADLHPGESKTDARHDYVIADAARTLPHTLRRVGTDDDALAGLTVLVGYDSDLAADATQLSNRLRDALLHIHTAGERLLGSHIHRPGVLGLLAAALTPADWSRLGSG
ncbi:hypothetical protein BCD48_35805 [Pseudofrankia sp. BMG5.36]|nr:hypothetical protein BCD48_35805 [Pseudofrankia sp. BMG5.36]